MPLTSPLKIGPMIGHGHFGEVYRGCDPAKGDVAVKKLKMLSGESPVEFLARGKKLIEEGRHLQTANHPNVVQVFNVLEDGAEVCLVIELCDRSLFDDYAKGPMCLGQARDVATHVCRGLEKIHYSGLIHRDIKPGNVLASGAVFKIGDFGLVTDKILAGYASANGYSDHLPPEFWRDRVTSIKSDVWALGMTTYRLLHGKVFYDEHFGSGTDKPQKRVIKGGFARRLPWLPHISHAPSPKHC
jgi:serine/threonine-protein kinase